MKKKLSIFLLAFAFALSACIFDSDDTVMNTWISDRGIPSGYEVQSLSIGDLMPLSVQAFVDTSPALANDRASLGLAANIAHDLVLDFAFFDETFFKDLNKSDSASAYLTLYLLRQFYTAEPFPADSLPLKEDLNLTVSWKLDKGGSKSFVDSIAKIKDDKWLSNLKKWKPDASADTTVKVSVSAKDSVLRVDIPLDFVAAMKKMSKACHLQLRLSAPNAERTYRFYGAGTTFFPKLWVKIAKEDNEFDPFRMAQVISNRETCSDCAVLHGGIFDSLVLEYETEPILKALSDFYGDEFPYQGEGDDVRQTVVLAQMTFARDDSQGTSELGLPVQVVVGSYVDSAGKSVRQMESYKLNKSLIVTKGHPNMVFFDGDSLALQVTYGLRDLINRAKDGRTFKMMMRLGYPVLQPMDSSYSDHVVSNKDTSFVFFSHFDHARYDFSSSVKQPSTLKLWLANKRGGK